MTHLDWLTSRRSTPSRLLVEPGPNETQLHKMLEAAIRVPDHGQLAPWRLLLVRGAERQRLGDHLAEIHQRKDSQLTASQLEKDRTRFTFAPLIIVVIARITPNHKTPEQEQLLSAGCVAYNLLLAARALNFGAQWLTGWAAYDADVAALLGLTQQERAIAFVHIGTNKETIPERSRPTLADVMSEWRSS